MIKTSVPMDLEVECVGDCLWWGIIDDCDTIKCQESWETEPYWYYVCPACKEPIDI